MATKFKVLQTQHRLKIDKMLEDEVNAGWTLVGPVQFTIHKEDPNKIGQCYYVATFSMEVSDLDQ